jgi:hypothetical protein
VKLRTFTRFNNVYPVLSVSGRQTVANKSLYLDLIIRPGAPFETRLSFLEEGPGPLSTVLGSEDVVAPASA